MDESSGRDSESHETVRNVVLVVLDTARARSVDVTGDPDTRERTRSGTDRPTTRRWTDSPRRERPSSGPSRRLRGRCRPTLRCLRGCFRPSTALTAGTRTSTTTCGRSRGVRRRRLSDDRRLEQHLDHRGVRLRPRLRRPPEGWQYIQSDADMGAVVRGEDTRENSRRRAIDSSTGTLVNAANILYSEVLQPAGDDGADRSTTWIENWLAGRKDDRPFFLFCNFIEPHVEYDPPREYAERYLPEEASYEEATAIRQDPRAYDCGDYQITDREFAMLRGLYRAELAYVDDQLAQLRRALEAAGEWENTLFVVCGDHGEHIGEHGFFGHQYNLYDTLIHVPLVVCGGPFAGGGRRSDLVQLLDLPRPSSSPSGSTIRRFEGSGPRGRFFPVRTTSPAMPSSPSTSLPSRRSSDSRPGSARSPTGCGRSTAGFGRSGRTSTSTSAATTASNGSTTSRPIRSSKPTSRATNPSGHVRSESASRTGSARSSRRPRTGRSRCARDQRATGGPRLPLIRSRGVALSSSGLRTRPLRADPRHQP